MPSCAFWTITLHLNYCSTDSTFVGFLNFARPSEWLKSSVHCLGSLKSLDPLWNKSPLDCKLLVLSMRPRMSTSRAAGIAVWVWRNCGWIRGPSLLVWPPRWRKSNEDHDMDPYFLSLFSKWTESLEWMNRCQVVKSIQECTSYDLASFKWLFWKEESGKQRICCVLYIPAAWKRQESPPCQWCNGGGPTVPAWKQILRSSEGWVCDALRLVRLLRLLKFQGFLL